jgi:hypothetical protein
MNASVRSRLAAGVAALAVTSLAVAQTSAPLPRPASTPTHAPVALAASVRALPVEPARPEQLAAAGAALHRIDPDASVRVPVALAVTPNANATTNASATTNAAADISPAGINEGYEWLLGWVTYGVQVAQYALQFVPYLGPFIGNQIGIVYYNLVVPIADSVVYGFIDPVVSDPLNINTWIAGVSAVATTTALALVNTGVAELNYFFGWLIPPIPPIGSFPFSAANATTTAAAATATPRAAAVRVAPGATAQAEKTATEANDATDASGVADAPGEPGTTTTTDGVETSRTEAVGTSTDPKATDTPAADAPATPDTSNSDDASPPSTPSTPNKTPTTSSAGSVGAQGDVRNSRGTARPGSSAVGGSRTAGGAKTKPGSAAGGSESAKSEAKSDSRSDSKSESKSGSSSE